MLSVCWWFPNSIFPVLKPSFKPDSCDSTAYLTSLLGYLRGISDLICSKPIPNPSAHTLATSRMFTTLVTGISIDQPILPNICSHFGILPFFPIAHKQLISKFYWLSTFKNIYWTQPLLTSITSTNLVQAAIITHLDSDIAVYPASLNSTTTVRL